MKTMHTAVAVSAGLLLAVLWAALPPRYVPPEAAPIAQQQQQQCPANSRLDGKLCACPEGTSWTGSECMQVWSSSARKVASVPPPSLAGGAADDGARPQALRY